MSYDNSVTGQDYLDTMRERLEDENPDLLEQLEARAEFELDSYFDNLDLDD